MEMMIPIVIERVLAIGCFVLGLSLLAYAQKWVAIGRRIAATEDFPLKLGVVSLTIGAAIVAGHNVWVMGPPVIVTLIGWLALVKGAMYFLAPDLIQSIALRSRIGLPRVMFAGLLYVALALVIGWQAFLRGR